MVLYHVCFRRLGHHEGLEIVEEGRRQRRDEVERSRQRVELRREEERRVGEEEGRRKDPLAECKARIQEDQEQLRRRQEEQVKALILALDQENTARETRRQQEIAERMARLLEEQERHKAICFETLAPPAQVYQCGNGHLMCQDCKARIRVSPSSLTFLPAADLWLLTFYY